MIDNDKSPRAPRKVAAAGPWLELWTTANGDIEQRPSAAALARAVYRRDLGICLGPVGHG